MNCKDNIVSARFISIWDGDTVELETDCKVNVETREVFDIAFIDDDCVDVLDGEYVEIIGVRYPVFKREDAEDTDFWYDG